MRHPLIASAIGSHRHTPMEILRFEKNYSFNRRLIMRFTHSNLKEFHDHDTNEKLRIIINPLDDFG